MRILRCLLMAAALVSALFCVSFAEEGLTTDLARHQKWDSFVLSGSGGQNARICSQAENDTCSLCLDFIEDRYVAQIIAMKDAGDRGKFFFRGPVSVPMRMRVDNRPVFYNSARVSETRTSLFVTMGAGLDADFLRQCQRGGYLRVKIEGIDPVVRFSLRGFTAAFDRAMRLKRALDLRRGDERFFDTDEDDELFSTPKEMV